MFDNTNGASIKCSETALPYSSLQNTFRIMNFQYQRIQKIVRSILLSTVPVSTKNKLGTQFIKFWKTRNGQVLLIGRPEYRGNWEFKITNSLKDTIATREGKEIPYKSLTSNCSACLTALRSSGFPSCNLLNKVNQ